MFYEEVEEVCIGKFLELIIDSIDLLDECVKEMCEKFLVNIVIEDYCYEVEEVVV